MFVFGRSRFFDCIKGECRISKHRTSAIFADVLCFLRHIIMGCAYHFPPTVIPNVCEESPVHCLTGKRTRNASLYEGGAERSEAEGVILPSLRATPFKALRALREEKYVFLCYANSARGFSLRLPLVRCFVKILPQAGIFPRIGRYGLRPPL